MYINLIGPFFSLQITLNKWNLHIVIYFHFLLIILAELCYHNGIIIKGTTLTLCINVRYISITIFHHWWVSFFHRSFLYFLKKTQRPVEIAKALLINVLLLGLLFFNFKYINETLHKNNTNIVFIGKIWRICNFYTNLY